MCFSLLVLYIHNTPHKNVFNFNFRKHLFVKSPAIVSKFNVYCIWVWALFFDVFQLFVTSVFAAIKVH